MHRFHVIDDAAVILRSRGIFRQAKVFQRDGDLYAAHAGGFIRLYSANATSLPLVSWDDIDIGASAATLAADNYGRLSLPAAMKQIEG